MAISARPYRSASDLREIQAATAEWIAAAGFRGYVNVSDVAMRLFNGMGRYNPDDIVRLWEDDDGRLVGWAMVYPGWNSYEALLHPDYRQSEVAMGILDWAERETSQWIRKSGQDNPTIQLDVFDGDTDRMTLLQRRGYSRGEHRGTISVRSLEESIPQPVLPDGFSIRSAEGESEADKLIALFNDSFGLSWTVEAYTKVMRSPGYLPENELVVVSPDGRFASSCILLPDARNRTGMVENVGTSASFRRLGLATALLYAGLQRMKMQGFTAAMVPHGAQVVGGAALYESVGFRPVYKIYRYTLALSER